MQGEKFTVITDHQRLLSLNNLRDPTGRLARWNTALQMYNIEFVHRKGALHKVPDALSRAWEENHKLAAIATATAEDPWYQGKISNIERNPKIYPDWKVVNGLMYAHRPKKSVDPLLPDIDSWKLVLPKQTEKKL